MEGTQIIVRDTAGTYLAGPINGKRASCTAGYDQAAEALAKKLWPDAEVSVELRLLTQGRAVFWAKPRAPRSPA